MSLNEAVGVYQEWHKFDPSGVLEIDIPEPKGKLTQLGLLKRLDYLSEKWNEGEEVYYYHHFRKNFPMLFKDEKGNYFIYGYIRVTSKGIDDWPTTNNYVWKPPNKKKGVSKLGYLQLLAYEDENGQLVSLMFNDRFYVSNTDKDFTYISSPMMENPAPCPYMAKIKKLVNKIEKNPAAMKRLEKALANYQVRENIDIPAVATVATAASKAAAVEAAKIAAAKLTASQAFLKSIVTGVSTATFAVGITATILGGILVTWLTDFIKNKVVPPEMPPPPKWVTHMVKQFKDAGATDLADIQERIEKVWAQQDFESKTAIYHREYGVGPTPKKSRGRSYMGKAKANAKCAVCGYPEEDHKFAIYKGYTDEHGFKKKMSVGTKAAPRSRANVELTKTDLAANRIRDMFRSPQYHGKVPDSDIKIILKPKGLWARAYGLDNMKRAWNSLKRNNFVRQEDRYWIWQYPVENHEFTEDELIKKALEMTFRWAYLGKIGSAGTAFKFFRDKGIKVAYQDVGYSFAQGRSKRHKEIAQHGHILAEYPEDKKEEEKKENPEGPKCPKCGGEGWLDVSGKYVCVKCGKVFGDDPLSSRFNPQANPIKSKAQWRFLKAQYPQMFEAWQKEAPVNYDELPERANPLTYGDYKEALEGEGWAVGDYKDMISKADTEEERRVLTHIKGEEEEHVDELTDLMQIKCRETGLEEDFRAAMMIPQENKKKRNPAETILSSMGGEGK